MARKYKTTNQPQSKVMVDEGNPADVLRENAVDDRLRSQVTDSKGSKNISGFLGELAKYTFGFSDGRMIDMVRNPPALVSDISQYPRKIRTPEGLGMLTVYAAKKGELQHVREGADALVEMIDEQARRHGGDKRWKELRDKTLPRARAVAADPQELINAVEKLSRLQPNEIRRQAPELMQIGDTRLKK